MGILRGVGLARSWGRGYGDGLGFAFCLGCSRGVMFDLALLPRFDAGREQADVCLSMLYVSLVLLYTTQTLLHSSNVPWR